MREFSEITLKVVVDRTDVTAARAVLTQCVDIIHEDSYVYRDHLSDVPVDDASSIDDPEIDVPVVEEEERIYVIVPLTVQIPLEGGGTHTVEMVPGRLMAQCAHVVSRMRAEEHAFYKTRPITTIVLSARNTRELLLLKE